MNMVVTGATRVIGRQAIPCMLAAGHEVAGLARSLLAPLAAGPRGAGHRHRAAHQPDRWAAFLVSAVWLGAVVACGMTGPLGKVAMVGVPVVAARRLPCMLRELPAVLGPERVAGLAD
jgi:nucleoside-diphosphate-sugar epimerase